METSERTGKQTAEKGKETLVVIEGNQREDINRPSRVILLASVIKIEFSNMEEGRARWGFLRLASPLVIYVHDVWPVRSHCRYTIEICSRDVSFNCDYSSFLRLPPEIFKKSRKLPRIRALEEAGRGEKRRKEAHRRSD